jgi:hypothetical protein
MTGLPVWHALQFQAAPTGEGSGVRPVQHRGALDRDRPRQTVGGRTIRHADGTTGEMARLAPGCEGFHLSQRVRPVLGAGCLLGRPRSGPAGSSRGSQAPRQPDTDGDAERQRQQAARDRARRPRARPVVAPHSSTWPAVAVATAPASIHDHADSRPAPIPKSDDRTVGRRPSATLSIAAGASTSEPMGRIGHSFSVAALRYQLVMAQHMPGSAEPVAA